MNLEETLYFIAIVPPAEICAEITHFKKDFAERFACRAALKLIPHLTLKAPFKLPPAEHRVLLEWFHSLKINIAPFEIELKDFGMFPKKLSPVIYVRAMMNSDLRNLQASIIEAFGTCFPLTRLPDTELNFSAHLTIAYRDLKPQDFLTAWNEYQQKNYKARFICSDFHLLQHDKTNWNLVATFPLARPQ